MSEIYLRCRNRIKKVHKRLSQEKSPAGLLITSGNTLYRTPGVAYPYRQNSNFFYLTGCKEEGYALLLCPEFSKPLLFKTAQTERETIYNGSFTDPEYYAKQLGAELILHNDIRKEILSRLSSLRILFYQNDISSLGYDIALALFNGSFQRFSLKHKIVKFVNADVILEPMRLIKDAHEVNQIETASKIAVEVLHTAAPFIKEDVYEYTLAHLIEYTMKQHGAVPAFLTIVASGESASILHYRKAQVWNSDLEINKSVANKKLQKGELVLIDCGAEYGNYASDISRTLPVGGIFSKTHLDLYKVVLESYNRAFELIRPGNTLSTIHYKAAEIIARWLLLRKLLTGTTLKEVLKLNSYRAFLPHSSCHFVGIDVHDSGNKTAQTEIILQPKMVITLEPGLYVQKMLSKNIERYQNIKLPAFGIRIEDTVLVTTKGAKSLTSKFPKDIQGITNLFK
jgi:Xaa-Pro aminopeptidase